MFRNEDHTFVICAYGVSSYLEECICSLKRQTIDSKILITTSTPNDLIYNLSEKYSIPVFENHGETGISGDWNFALSTAETQLITIAHQDDVYMPLYKEIMLERMNRAKDPILFSSAYGELRNNNEIYSSRLLNIKKIMNLPISAMPQSVFARRLSLSIGNAICCPSVTYVKSIAEHNLFKKGFESNIDWQQWERLSKIKGSFVYYDKPLMLHRIHEDSETSRIIGNDKRKSEDFCMFNLFWPEPVAKALTSLYSKAEESNNI